MSCGAGNSAIEELKEMRSVVAALTKRIAALEAKMETRFTDPEDGED